MAPSVEKRSVSAAASSDGEVVDEVHVPVSRSRDFGIGPPSIIVDPRHRSMIAILEAHERSVDLLCRC
jgi:hypothetical protein